MNVTSQFHICIEICELITTFQTDTIEVYVKRIQSNYKFSTFYLNY